MEQFWPYFQSYILFLPLMFLALLALTVPFVLNDALAESRGKSRGLIFFLTWMFSYIVTLILAFVEVETEAVVPEYLKKVIIGCLIISVLFTIPLAIYRGNNLIHSRQQAERVIEMQKMESEINKLLNN